MPTAEERERKRLKNSGLASNRILEKDITRAEMGEEGVSATTRNRAIREAKMDARMAPQREAKAQRLADEIQGISTRAKEQQASFDNSPIGAFQQRMRTGGMGERPLTSMAPAAATAGGSAPASAPVAAPGRVNAAALSHLGLDVGPANRGGALQTLPASPSTGRGTMETLPAKPGGGGVLEPLSSVRPGYYEAEDVNYPSKQSFIGGITDAQGSPIGVGSNMMSDPYTDEEIAKAKRFDPTMRPQLPSTPEAAAALDEYIAREKTMQQDYGIGAQPPRDPYMASLPPRQAAPTPGVTTLQPGRTSAFSRADAQALAALDPRALDEARSLAALPESMPAKMTGSFGGKSFEMQPSARVDRNALARLYSQAQTRQGQERQDSVRAQEQGGRERLVAIPGQQLTDRAKLDNETKIKIAQMEAELKRPLNEAEIAKINAQTAAVTGGETRAQAQAARQKSPEQEAIDAALAEAQASPFAQTPEGRARITALAKRSTAGQAVPESVAGAAGPLPDVGQAAAEVMADPGIAAIIARAKETVPGFFTGGQGRQTGAAARQLAERAITARLTRAGVSPEDAQAVITSILGPGAQNTMASGANIAAAGARMLPMGLGNLPANALNAIGR